MQSIAMHGLFSFPRGRDITTATLIKCGHNDTSPLCDGLVLYPELFLVMHQLYLPPSLELLPGNLCAQEELGPSTNIRATLTWNQIHKVGTSLCTLALIQQGQESCLQPCWATCSDRWHEGNISLHISFYNSERTAPNTARVTQKVVGTAKAGRSPPPWRTQGQGASSWSTLSWGPQNFGGCRKLYFSSFKLKVN